MAKNNDKNPNNNSQNREQESAGRVGRMNEERRQAEIAEEEKKKKAEKEKKEQAGEKPNAFNTMTSNLLKASWESLIESFGLTLIWIDIHVFGTLVLGNKLFCKLGMEWVPNALKEARFKEAEKLGKTVGAFEEIGVIGLNLGCLLIIIVVCMIVAMILQVVENPIASFGELVKWMWNATAGTVTAWVKS